MSRIADASPETPISDPLAEAPLPSFRMRAVGGHTAVYAVGTVIAKSIGFLMLPVYTRYLTPGDYGVLALIEMTLEVVSILAGAQLAPGIFRFYHKASDEVQRHEVVSTALLTIAAGYAAVGLLCLAGAELLALLVFRGTEHADLIRIASVGLIFQSLTIVPIAYARVRDRSMLIVSATLAKIVLGLALNVFFLVFLGWGVRSLLVSLLITNVVIGIALTTWTVRAVGLRYSSSAVSDLLRYGWPLIVSYFAAFLYTFGDRFFLNAYASPDAVGLYNLAYQFGFLLMIVGFGPFEQVWGPKRFEVAKRPDRDALLARGFIYGNVVMVSCAVLLGVFIDDFLEIMTTPAFHSAGVMVPVILAAYILNAWSIVHDIGILVRERTKFITMANWASAAVALVAYSVLIPWLLGMGAAIATLLAFGVRWAIVYSVSQRLWPVRYEWGPVLRVLGAGATVVLIATFMPARSLGLSIAVHTALVGLYVAALFVLPVLTPREKRLSAAAVQGIMRRLRGRTPAVSGGATK